MEVHILPQMDNETNDGDQRSHQERQETVMLDCSTCQEQRSEGQQD
jgi:hypothetical protein